MQFDLTEMEDKMVRITANEIKTNGLTAIKTALKNDEETVITERGKERFVVMDLERYNQLREYELETALLESLRDVENGQFIEETVDEHLQRIKNV